MGDSIYSPVQQMKKIQGSQDWDGTLPEPVKEWFGWMKEMQEKARFENQSQVIRFNDSLQRYARWWGVRLNYGSRG